NVNAFVTNVDARAGDKLSNLALSLAAEAAAQLVIVLSHCPAASTPRLEVVFSTEFMKAGTARNITSLTSVSPVQPEKRGCGARSFPDRLCPHAISSGR